jgi:hypothetical protein
MSPALETLLVGNISRMASAFGGTLVVEGQGGPIPYLPVVPLDGGGLDEGFDDTGKRARVAVTKQAWTISAPEPGIFLTLSQYPGKTFELISGGVTERNVDWVLDLMEVN